MEYCRGYTCDLRPGNEMLAMTVTEFFFGFSGQANERESASVSTKLRLHEISPDNAARIWRRLPR